MKQLSVMQDFGQTGSKKYTFFASANVAFENIPSQVSQHLQKTNVIVLTERDNIMRYQTGASSDCWWRTNTITL